MSSLVIVALPAEDDLVWKVSSEKVPHLTLMYLGEVTEDNNVQRMADFVEHALNVNEHGPFYLSVDYRGELGPDKADVLFFEGGWEAKWIKQLRGHLLQQNDIRNAFEANDQFPEWVPHLTLGYPDAPAKEVPDDRRFYSVEFDRLAIWTGDYEGPEFRLKWSDRDSMCEESPVLAYGDVGASVVPQLLTAGNDKAAKILSANDIRELAGLDPLEHVGVKGMRWGQRKDTTVTVNGKTKQVTAKKAAKLDAAWEKNQYTLPKAVERHNAMAEHFNQRIGALNDKYKDHDFSKVDWENPSSWSPKQNQYMKEVGDLETAGYHHAVAQELPSPTGKKKTVLETKGDQLSVVVKSVDAKHAVTVEDGDEVFVFKITRNAKGLITDAKPVENAMAQSEEMVSDFIEHFGTKGMKWGVRKDKVANAVSSAAQKAGPKIKSGLKAVGRGLAAVGASLAESAWQGSTYSDSTHEEIHNHVAKQIDNHVAKLQKSPKYRGKNLHADSNLRNEYYQDVAKVTDSAYRRAVKDTIGTSPSGTKSAHYINDVRGARIEVRDKKSGFPESESPLSSMKDIQTRKSVEALKTQSATHAATTDAPDLEIEIKLDDNGQISGVGFVPPTEGMVHSMAEGEAFVLEHFGVKGMRWGLRKERPAPEAVAPSATSKVPRGTKRKTKIETQGGENHPAHEDAIKVAEAQAKLKKSGAAALSNQELRDVATRVQLENQVSLLTGHKGKQFVRGQLEAEGKNLAKAGLREGLRNPAGTAGAVRKTAKGVRRGAAVAATTAALL